MLHVLGGGYYAAYDVSQCVQSAPQRLKEEVNSLKDSMEKMREKYEAKLDAAAIEKADALNRLRVAAGQPGGA